MKLKYYMMSIVLMTMASVSFTSCSDDDEPATTPELTLDNELKKVKVGPENRIALDIIQGTGQYNAYSLDPEVAAVVTGDDGNVYIEGLKNGFTSIVVSDASGTYKSFPVSVYTYDEILLSHTEFNFEITMGTSATNSECSVLEGNGDYTVESADARVSARINAETGVITLSAKAGKDGYSALITVKDMSGLEAVLTVNVTPVMDPFTASELEQIMAQTATTLYGQCKDPSDGTQPYYYGYWQWGYGAWTNADSNGTHTLGWWCNMYGSDYGGLRVEYPAGTAVNTEVAAKLFYQYSYISWYDCYEYDGTAKVLVDDETRIVAIWWNIDMENELINRAYFVYKKS